VPDVELSADRPAVVRVGAAEEYRLRPGGHLGPRYEAIAVGVAVGVGHHEVAAGWVSSLEPLRESAQAEDDRRDALAEVDHTVLVAPGRGRDAPRDVRPVHHLRRREDLDPLVAHAADVLE